MKKCFFALTVAALLCGCDKQTKINTQKIEVLTRNISQFEQNQTKQMAAIQAELTSLGPMLDKMNDFYFEKSHDQAFFFHTNTLYLLLTVDKKIESQLQVADTERAAQNAAQNTQTYAYYTNQMGTLFLCTAQIQDAITAGERRLEDNLTAETLRSSAATKDELLKQIKVLTPDTEEIARRKELAADVAQIKTELEVIKAQLGQLTNRPAVR
jgi:hypothetical protein